QDRAPFRVRATGNGFESRTRETLAPMLRRHRHVVDVRLARRFIKAKPHDSNLFTGRCVKDPEEMVTRGVEALRQRLFELAVDKPLCLDIWDVICQRALRSVGWTDRAEEGAQFRLRNT